MCVYVCSDELKRLIGNDSTVRGMAR